MDKELNVTKSSISQKQKQIPFFPESIFGRSKDKSEDERKEIMKTVKKELEEKENYKPQLTCLQKEMLGKELIEWASKKNWDKVKELVEKGADLTSTNSQKMNVLMYSVALGNKEIVQLLLEKGMTLNVEDKKGHNIVMFSTYNHDSEFLEYLYNLEKFDFNAKDKEGKTALFYAIQNNNPVAISHLMKQGVVEIVDGENFITKCIEDKKDPKIIKELLNHIPVSSEYIVDNIRSLKYKSKEEKEDFLNYLEMMIEKVPDKKEDLLNHFLWIGALYNKRKMFKRAVEKGADVNLTIDHNQKTILMFVAEKGYFDLVKIIVRKNRWLVNDIDSNWDNCLAYCCTDIKNKEMVEFLLKHKVDPNRTGRYGPDNLTRTASSPNLFEISKLLIEYGANINANINKRRNFSHICEAASVNNIKLVKLLLEKKVNLNEKDYFSKTPLMWSARNGHIEVVKLLIENGADINVKYYEGKTALDYAKENNHLEIIEMLRNAGAKE